MTGDGFATFDAAYVLGALSPEDRRAYEQHLRQCPSCAESVRQLAGLPGLLACVPAEEVVAEHHAGEPSADDSPGADDPPATLLAALLARARRERRRSRWVKAGATALAAAACLVAVLLAVNRPDAVPPPPPGTPMVAVVPAPVHATARLVGASWGTRVELRCTYDPGTAYPAVTYALVVIDKQGRAQQAATWRAVPGTSTITGATAVPRADISAVEVRTAAGRAVLRLPG